MTITKKASSKDELDYSDEGESELDPLHTLLIQVAGETKTGKTTGVCKLGKKILWISFDHETKPIADKLNKEAGTNITTKSGDRYLRVRGSDGVVRSVSKSKMPKAASKNMEYLKGLLNPALYDGPFDVVAFDSTEDLRTYAAWAARGDYSSKKRPNGFGMEEDIPEENAAFWEIRNNHLRDLMELAQLLSTRIVAFTTGFTYKREKDQIPELIKPNWTKRADIVFTATAVRPKFKKAGERIIPEFYFDVFSCKRDDELPPTGERYDMKADLLIKAMDEYFDTLEAA